MHTLSEITAEFGKDMIGNTATTFNELSKSLKVIIGQPCWAIFAKTNSLMDVHCGKKSLRRSSKNKLRANKNLQEHEGEICFSIYCAWRVDSLDAVICSSADDGSDYEWRVSCSEAEILAPIDYYNNDNSAKLKGLEQITNQEIINFDLLFPSFDLVLYFSNSLNLKIFCDQSNQVDATDNYTIFFPNKCYVIGSRSEAHRKF